MNCNECKNKVSDMLPYSKCAGTAPVPCKGGCGDKCNDCGCPQPIQSIVQPYPERPGILRFNYGGHSVEYDFTNMIKMTQTDTSVAINTNDRQMVYNAERHQDTITAKELGSILHIADIGDVDITGVENNSLFVFQKDSNCGQNCEGINNSWIAWNANEHLATELQYAMGFDADGNPLALQPPVHTNQYYNLGWNAQNKLSYGQPVEFANFPVDDDNYAYISCFDPKTKQPGYVKVKKGSTVTV